MNSLLLFALIANVDNSTSAWKLQEVVSGHGPLPALVKIQSSALAQLNLSRRDDWPQRVRLRNALPTIEISMGSDLDDDVRVSVGRSESRYRGREFGFRIKARWHLSALMMDQSELRVFKELNAQQTVRRETLDEISKLYLKRVELLFLPRTLKRQLQALKLESRMNALTGGEYFGANNERN